MLTQQRILVLAKQPTIDRMDAASIARMDRAGVIDRATLQQGSIAHQHSLQQVLEALRDHQVHCVMIHELTLAMTRDIDLAVTVGGDGSVLTMHPYLDRIPLLAVNSDQQRSVGHFTRCTAENFSQFLTAWLEQHHQVSTLPRLSLNVGGENFRILNDCLITTSNPGMMSRYRLQTPDASADHWSSGVWSRQLPAVVARFIALVSPRRYHQLKLRCVGKYVSHFMAAVDRNSFLVCNNRYSSCRSFLHNQA